MRWTDGHVWVLDNLIVKSKPYFNYKYVLMRDDKPQTWERGENRIADLNLLNDLNINGDAALLQSFGDSMNFVQG